MSELFAVYSLASTYPELGTYEFKIVLSPRHFKNSHESRVELIDSDGRPLLAEVSKWGRKMNCKFTVTESVPDGAAQARLSLVDDEGRTHSDRLVFWVIKP